jgi:hypothetical protein
MEKLAFYSNQLERAFLTLDKAEAEKILTEALRSGSPVEIAGELVSLTLNRIGAAWERRETCTVAGLYEWNDL